MQSESENASWWLSMIFSLCSSVLYSFTLWSQLFPLAKHACYQLWILMFLFPCVWFSRENAPNHYQVLPIQIEVLLRRWFVSDVLPILKTENKWSCHHWPYMQQHRLCHTVSKHFVGGTVTTYVLQFVKGSHLPICSKRKNHWCH
jgi:hypothetical protein